MPSFLGVNRLLRWGKVLLSALAGIGLVAALGVLVLAGGCVHTAEFRDGRGRVVPGSIAAMETVRLGGVGQRVWFRGLSRSSPALILLHGGPGASESALFRHYNAGLERHFLVVYWEQRGTGRSYHGDIDPGSMTIARLLADLDQLVDLVRARFDQRRVVLLGHSWGTVLGTLYAIEHPAKVAAYVGVAQIASTAEGRRLEYDHTLSQARQRGHAEAIAQLEQIGPPPYESVDELLAVGRWTERLGTPGHVPVSTGALILAALRTDEANLVDLIRFGQGNRFSLERLEAEIARLDLAGRYRCFEVPVVFLLGRHDWHVPATLAARYFDQIEAPCKRLVWFERSGHNPPFEEPAKFERVMIDQVLPLARVPGACAG